MVNLVLFDMDGVIFEGKNFWLDLHKAMGTEKQAWQLWEGLGIRDYRKLGELTAKKLWRQKSSDKFWRLINERKTSNGIGEVFSYLRKNHIKSAIVSSGPYQLAEKAQRLFDISEIRANKLDIGENGQFTGKVDIQVDDNHKDIPAQELMAKFGATFETTAMIGDTRNDVLIARLASVSIAYNSDDDALLKACHHNLEANQICNVIDILRKS
ncbi:HAD family hydrolase [Nitrosomonas sp.]|uniref:HAD family hydrolase n=1 Tax=Nitrosomonas sp. TaxID=42353 RepID=UPI001D4EA5DF|nr:HAD-IB family phosphatase [Nitrosomonas sp.]MBX3616957.1 HAD-IB family phosphatase [Nitrosomonas sp.]